MGQVFIDKVMMCSTLNVPPDQPWEKKRQGREMFGIVGSLYCFQKLNLHWIFISWEKNHDLVFIFKTKQEPKVLLIVVVLAVQHT